MLNQYLPLGSYFKGNWQYNEQWDLGPTIVGAFEYTVKIFKSPSSKYKWEVFVKEITGSDVFKTKNMCGEQPDWGGMLTVTAFAIQKIIKEW